MDRGNALYDRDIMDDAENNPRNMNHYEKVIARGTPIPTALEPMIMKFIEDARDADEDRS